VRNHANLKLLPMSPRRSVRLWLPFSRVWTWFFTRRFPFGFTAA
jgi:hypothetical protein